MLKIPPTIYVTRDFEKALGLDLDTPNYFVVANATDFARENSQGRENVLLIESDKTLDTFELLQNQKVAEFIGACLKIDSPRGAILVFKNTSQIERICQEKDWPLLNPDSKLADKIENKISQIDFLENLRQYFPKSEVAELKDIAWPGEKFILQFGHSHSGEGTMLIESESEFREIQEKFPRRKARAAKFIAGSIFTNNNVVAKDEILIGNISFQITGVSPFTDLEFATVGNDWGLAQEKLSAAEQEKFEKIARRVGQELRRLGWQGLFGIDIVKEESSGKLYLLEINARQPASAALESRLQNEKREAESELAIFEAHLLSLWDKLDDSTANLVRIEEGSQLVQRKTRGIDSAKIEALKNKLARMKNEKPILIEYRNKKENSELLRIQSRVSLLPFLE